MASKIPNALVIFNAVFRKYAKVLPNNALNGIVVVFDLANRFKIVRNLINYLNVEELGRINC